MLAGYWLWLKGAHFKYNSCFQDLRLSDVAICRYLDLLSSFLEANQERVNSTDGAYVMLCITQFNLKIKLHNMYIELIAHK